MRENRNTRLLAHVQKKLNMQVNVTIGHIDIAD